MSTKPNQDQDISHECLKTLKFEPVDLTVCLVWHVTCCLPTDGHQGCAA